MSESDASEKAVLLCLLARWPYGAKSAEIGDYLGGFDGRVIGGKMRSLVAKGLAQSNGRGRWFATSAAYYARELLS